MQQDISPVNLPVSIRRQLREGERVVWHGRPGRPRVLPPAAKLEIGASTVLCTALLVWLHETGLIGWSIVAMALVVVMPTLILLRFRMEVRTCLRTAYVLTDERALIIESGWFRDAVTSFQLAALADVARHIDPSGLGTIVFAGPCEVSNLLTGRRQYAHDDEDRPAGCFVRIDDAQQVAGLVDRARHPAGTPDWALPLPASPAYGRE